MGDSAGKSRLIGWWKDTTDARFLYAILASDWLLKVKLETDSLLKVHLVSDLLLKD